MIKEPPSRIVAKHADDWQTIAMHEAGHVVYGIAVGVPVTGAWIAYDRALFGRWSVLGRTTVTPGVSSGDGDEAALFAGGFSYAGVQAEAMWLAARDNRSLNATTRYAETTKTNLAGDMAEMWSDLDDVTLTLDDIRQATHAVLFDFWDTLVAVADQLREHGEVSYDDLAHIL